MTERMRNRDDSPYIWDALKGLDFADFGQLSPTKTIAGFDASCTDSAEVSGT
jgi:hypothetical protein